ncbi:hypothetical protein P4216_28470, partial [Bacillus thuringiensis]|nr:hypothetical protein [Bacillus thuringiensis]
QPPYMVHNQFETKKGITAAKIKYTPSKKLVEGMHDLSICIQGIVEIFCTHITKKMEVIMSNSQILFK